MKICASVANPSAVPIQIIAATRGAVHVLVNVSSRDEVVMVP